MAGDPIGGRYRLDSLLGRGAMSEVWCADDLELERRVALKLLAPDADRERFAREARAAAALAHPNITQLYDYGEAEGRPFMVLEYLPGGTLADRLTPGEPLDDATAEEVAADVAAGLAHAHARGLVHRDLKPANILFNGEGRAKIADFGIARLGQGGTLTQAGTVLGTAAYISPEQAAGEPATPASDVYSFGVILYLLLTGRLPFESDDALALVSLHRDATPPPLEDLRADAPPALAAVTSSALAKDPAARPRDGAALVAALSGHATAAEATGAASAAAAVAATAVLPAAAAPGAPPPRRHRRMPFVLAGVLALLAAGGAALAFAVAPSGNDAPATTSQTPPSFSHTVTGRHHGPTTSRTIAPAVVTTPSTSASTSTAATTATTRTTTRHRLRTTTGPSVTIITLPTTTSPVDTVPPSTDTTTAPTTTPTTTAGTTTGP